MARKFYEEAKDRIPNQRAKILEALRNAGSQGLTNVQLGKIALRWGARIQELYVQGYVISVESVGDGVTRYRLVKEPGHIKPEPPKAVDLLLEAIEKDHDGIITKEELVTLLAELNFNVTRKPNSHKQAG